LSDYVLQLMKLQQMMPERRCDPQWFYEARKNIVMFHEHTWGAWNSISAPDDAFAVEQWNYKKAFIDSTKKYIQKIETVLLPQYSSDPSLIVYNTLPWSRSGYVETCIPPNMHGNVLHGPHGQLINFQKLSNGNIGFIARDVPAMGSVRYHFMLSYFVNYVYPGSYHLQLDSMIGVVDHLRDKSTEWIDTSQYDGLGQALAVVGFDVDHPETSKATHIEFSDSGNIVRTIKISSSLRGTKGLTCEISYFPSLDHFKIRWVIDKEAIRTKESLHFVLPFNIANPVDRVGVSDTCYVPGVGQLRGSNKDFYSVQRWIDISDTTKGVTVSSPQAALFELGAITDEHPVNQGVRAWKDSAMVSSTLFVYALNNYWNTNFKADQQGEIIIDCYFRFHQAFEMLSVRQFGEEIHAPLIPHWE
jgi:alpha-mannosidase